MATPTQELRGAVVVYRSGPCAASACAPADLAANEIEDDVNRQHPTGISSHWKISDDEAFSNGPANGCVCELDASRRHWLLTC